MNNIANHSRWNRKRVSGWVTVILLSLAIPVAIDQEYFRYNAYILPITVLVVMLLYLFLIATGSAVSAKVRSWHVGIGVSSPVKYFLIVATAGGVIALVIASVGWFAIRRSQQHIAELRANRSVSPESLHPIPAAPGHGQAVPDNTATVGDSLKRSERKRPESVPQSLTADAKQQSDHRDRRVLAPPSTSASNLSGANQTPLMDPLTLRSAPPIYAPGGVVSVGQQGGITASQVNINTSTPGLGLLRRQPIPYQSDPKVLLDNGQRVAASAKSSHELYVVVLLSISTQAEKTAKQSRITDVLRMLSSLQGVHVFFSPGPGAYTLIKHDQATTIGGNLSLDSDGTDSLYYFDPNMKTEALRIKEALGGDSSIKRFEYREVPKVANGVYQDILAVSGIDMEVIL